MIVVSVKKICLVGLRREIRKFKRERERERLVFEKCWFFFKFLMNRFVNLMF